MISVFDKKEDCCGCTACKSICPTQAITMKPDKEGFLYPVINQELCSDCGICRNVCAFQTGYDISHNLESPEVYALKHKSDEVRRSSSSGGAFTAISDYILSIGGVVYGAAFDQELQVLHKRAESKTDRNKFRGSKYVESNLNDVFYQIRQDLLNGKYVLFTGTSCQVAGLKKYLLKLKTNMERLILVDLICHGVGSPLIFKDFVSYLERRNKSEVVEYYFRSKVAGWGHTEQIIFRNGRNDYSSTLSQLHKKLFYSNLCLRPSCYECRYANIRRPSDITIADFWGIENKFPEFKDDLGISAVIINTHQGSIIHSKLNDIVTITCNIQDCLRKQKNLHSPSPLNPKREQFWQDYYKYGFEYIAQKYAGYSFRGRVKSLLKDFLKKIGLLMYVKKLVR